MNEKKMYLKQLVSQKLFLFIFLLVFCFSGTLSIITIISGGDNFKLGISVSIISILILFLLGIKIDQIDILIGVLIIIVILSSLYNQSSPIQVVYFLRAIFYFYLIYKVTRSCINSNNIKQIVLWVIRIAMIQLPILLIQKFSYTYFPSVIHNRISEVDFGTGTFNIHGDAAMGFFVVLVIIFLLFKPNKNYFIKGKWIILVWLTLTIFFTNSELIKLLVVFVWAFFFIVKLRNPKILALLLISLIILFTIASFGVLNSTIEHLSYIVRGTLNTSSENMEIFLSGGYARGAAIKYYLDKGIFLLGDGPSSYTDLETNQKIVGNHGHFYEFYSEVGQLGWLCSVLILFLIAFPIKDGLIRVDWASFLFFVSIMALTLTSPIMDNFAVVLIYCIMSTTHLIPKKDRIIGFWM